jgi:tetratricopeptide (TPR) repeat protein
VAAAGPSDGIGRVRERRGAAAVRNSNHTSGALSLGKGSPAATATYCLVFACASLCHADPIPAPTPSLPPAVAHLTDAQDKLGSGKLKPAAEARSKADALYAEAMLLPQDSTGDQQTALGLFRQIVALDPSFTEAQIKLANLFLQSGQTDQALSQLRAASAAHPDSIPIAVALGYTLRLGGQNDEAVRICTRALAKDSSQTAAMRVLLEVASDQDDLAGGVLHVSDILKKASDVTSATWLNFAKLYLEIARGQRFPPGGEVILRTRLPLLQEAAAIPPPDVDTLTQLADNYRDLGRKIEALSTLQRAAALEPANADLILRCAGLEADLNETDDAIKDYKKAYALNPSQPGLRDLLGNLYIENGHYNDAVALFESALADSPQNPGVLIDLGIAYEGAHHPEKAQACFQQVFDSVACPVEAYLKLALFQVEHKEFKEAGGTLASAQAHFPQSANVRFYQAIQHRYEKNYPAAIASLAEVRTLATGADAGALDPGYYMECALTLNLAGKKADLEAVLREALGKFPDNAELMNELAYYWADEDQHLDEALNLSRRATSLEPDNGPILDTLGWVYFQKDQAKDALPYLQRAAFLTNNDPVVLQHVGDAYLKLGQRREAISAWSHALEKDPHNGDLANRIDAAQAQAKNAQLRSAPRP